MRVKMTAKFFNQETEKKKTEKITSNVFVLQIIFYEYKRPLHFFFDGNLCNLTFRLKKNAHTTCNLWSFTILVSHFFIPRFFRVGKDVAKFRSL